MSDEETFVRARSNKHEGAPSSQCSRGSSQAAASNSSAREHGLKSSSSIFTDVAHRNSRSRGTTRRGPCNDPAPSYRPRKRKSGRSPRSRPWLSSTTTQISLPSFLMTHGIAFTDGLCVVGTLHCAGVATGERDNR
ncbi:hypothetical protein HPP92_017248 [Vanilla planifolia]|uniref:Uncharacterized protein n=1 Tax=Vanilla planifolia TaxID=51239 RepID=A0A835UPG4_VANPL|nr:hypothetical protein HPP92_017248 [Vanilla planifolia]